MHQLPVLPPHASCLFAAYPYSHADPLTSILLQGLAQYKPEVNDVHKLGTCSSLGTQKPLKPED